MSAERKMMRKKQQSQLKLVTSKKKREITLRRKFQITNVEDLIYKDISLKREYRIVKFLKKLNPTDKLQQFADYLEKTEKRLNENYSKK